MQINLNIAKIRDVKTPERGTNLSVGVDFYIPNFDPKFIEDLMMYNSPDRFEIKHIEKENEFMIVIKPQKNILIPSGIVVSLPEDYNLIAFPKSGVAFKMGLDVGACVIDPDYQGEIKINMINYTAGPVSLRFGQKIIQYVMLPAIYASVIVNEYSELHPEESERGSNGFGSTGVI